MLMDSANPAVYQRLPVSDSVLFSLEASKPSIDESQSRFSGPHFPTYYPPLLGEEETSYTRHRYEIP
ncbi:hypothetical protein E2C01_072614 [Portunus trituberculatus]|uniref:Uncharacterized protein n=1 Tax=Portunus trituberculatus TaxID=210409 RepID=A0A5B7IBT8_PORTR|nr:hypothetical protein [Portunus trituberculatus]